MTDIDSTSTSSLGLVDWRDPAVLTAAPFAAAAGAGPRTGWMDEMDADGWMDGDTDALHRQMGATHGDAERVAQHHEHMLERDLQLRQRHDEIMNRYPDMQEHLDAFAGAPGPARWPGPAHAKAEW